MRRAGSCVLALAAVVLLQSSTLAANGSPIQGTGRSKPCRPVQIERNMGPGPFYAGPLVDTHFHMPPPVDGGPNPQLDRDVTLAEIVCTFRAEGTSKAFAFFPVYESFPSRVFVRSAAKAKKRYPKRFVPFVMPPSSDDNPPSVDAKRLKRILRGQRGLFDGYGEIGLYQIEGRSADEYPPDAAFFQRIYPVVRRHDLVVYFHPGEGHEDNLERALQQNPAITFIVHGDEIQEAMPGILSRHPNVYYTIDALYGDQWLMRPDLSKQNFMNAFKDFAPLLDVDLATWKTLIETYPDRFMWGTDRGDATWTFDRDVGQTLADYGRAFIGRLDPSVQERFAYQNAERLLAK